MLAATAVGGRGARLRAPPREDLFFHLLGTAHGSHRAHVVPTIEKSTDVSVTASMALEVQWYRRTTTPPRGDVIGVEIESTGVQVGVKPNSIASFTDLSTSLKDFRTIDESDCSEGTLVLANPERACYLGRRDGPDVPCVARDSLFKQ